MRNLADTPDRFEIDPAEQIKLMRALRGAGREIIGCYHSHPNGSAEPSADRSEKRRRRGIPLADRRRRARQGSASFPPSSFGAGLLRSVRLARATAAKV